MKKALMWIALYSAGVILGTIYLLLRLTRIIRVKGGSFLPRWTGGIIVVSNHPSMIETAILPLLFFWPAMIMPHRLFPWSTPDYRNFYSKWWFAPFRMRSIPIVRGDRNPARNKGAVEKMMQVVRQGGTLILFAEGGRTWKGPQAGEHFSSSKKDNVIRQIKPGVASLAIRTEAVIAPVWVQLRPFGITVKIGETFKLLPGTSQEEAIGLIGEKLLTLSDM